MTKSLICKPSFTVLVGDFNVRKTCEGTTINISFIFISFNCSDVLRRNGTAVDAAIATLFCNGAIHSHSMGLGGGFLMTVFIKAENKVYSLTAREAAPKAAFETMYTVRKAFPTYAQGLLVTLFFGQNGHK